MADRPTTPEDGEPLSAFFNATLSFVTNVSGDIVKACGADPDAELIQANATLVHNHFRKLFDTALAGYAGANIGVRKGVLEALAVADGVGLASVGEKAARSTVAKAVFGGGFFSWLSKYLFEIKKLIRLIFELIFGTVPHWLDVILDLIDQFWDMIMELLSGVFGFNRREVARDISFGAVNGLNEVAAVQRLRAASAEMSKADED